MELSVHYFDKQVNAILTKPVTLFTMGSRRFDRCTLSPAFLSALQHWKPQSISFLDLPAEIRNQIYHLLTHDSNGRYIKHHQFQSRVSVKLPPVMLMQTCKQVQRELLPLYLRTIDLQLHVGGGRQDSISSPTSLPLPASQMWKWLNQNDRAFTDYFHTMTIQTTNCRFHCRVLVTDSKVVFVKLHSFTHRISSAMITNVSIAIRDNILRTLGTSPTGLLGYQHLAMARKEIGPLLELHLWRRQEFIWQSTKNQEAPYSTHKYPTRCIAYGCYECYLIAQAEKEGLPRVIPAVSFESPDQIRQRLLWNRDEEKWRRRKAAEAEGALSEKQLCDYDRHLIKEAEQESVPRLIRAASSSPDELEMYERWLRLL